jgi:hypothetical protein
MCPCVLQVGDSVLGVGLPGCSWEAGESEADRETSMAGRVILSPHGSNAADFPLHLALGLWGLCSWILVNGEAPSAAPITVRAFCCMEHCNLWQASATGKNKCSAA